MSLTKVSYSMILGASANVLDFGADKTGSADCALAINAAILASDSVYFPVGTYKIQSPIRLKNYTQLVGENANTTIIDANGTMTGAITPPDDSGNNPAFNVYVCGLTINGNGNPAIYTGGPDDVSPRMTGIVERCSLTGAPAIKSIGFLAPIFQYNLITAEDNANCVQMIGPNIIAIKFINNTFFAGAGKPCIYISPPASTSSLVQNITIDGNTFEVCDYGAIELRSVYDFSIKNNGVYDITTVNAPQFVFRSAGGGAVQCISGVIQGNQSAFSAAVHPTMQLTGGSHTVTSNRFTKIDLYPTGSLGSTTSSSFFVSGGAEIVNNLASNNTIVGSGYSYTHAKTTAEEITYAATIQPDCALDQVKIITLTGSAIISLPVNSLGKAGDTLNFIFIQNGTGGYTVTWDVTYFKSNWSNTGNTANKRSSVTFVYDGTYWTQMGAQNPWS